LNAIHCGGVCSPPNFISVSTNEDTDCINMRWQRLDDLPCNFRFDVAWALRIKVQPDHLCTEFDAHARVVHIRNAADFDLYRSRHGKSQTGGRLVGRVTL